MKNLFIPASVLFLILFSSQVSAAVFASDSTGKVKNIFYTNESIYVYANESLTQSADSVKIYIVSNTDSWSNGTAFTPVVPIVTANTNSTGNIPVTLLWNPGTNAGTYDIAIDANRDGIFNKSVDFVANESTAGLQILEVPKPSITFSLGEKSPSNYDWQYGNVSQSAIMQFKASAGPVGDVIIGSMDLAAGGIGDDKAGISLVRLFSDGDSNGVFDSGDETIAFGKFSSNNGVFQAIPEQELVIKANATSYFIITYAMSNSIYNGDTFNFDVVSVSVSGKSGEKATLSGLPLKSVAMTIKGAPQTSTTNKSEEMICYDHSNESSCIIASCQWCAADNMCKNTTDTCTKTCSGSVEFSISKIGETLNATISGLNNCESKVVTISEDSCENDAIISCDVASSGCSVIFSSPSEGQHNYFACIDLNNDTVIESSEQNSHLVVIQQEQGIKNEPENPEFNILLIIVPAIIAVIVLVFLLFRKKDKYEELKEKWGTFRKKTY